MMNDVTNVGVSRQEGGLGVWGRTCNTPLASCEPKIPKCIEEHLVCPSPPLPPQKGIIFMKLTHHAVQPPSKVYA